MSTKARRPHDNPACRCDGCKGFDRPRLEEAEIIRKASLCVKLARKMLPGADDYEIEAAAMDLLDKSTEEIEHLLETS